MTTTRMPGRAQYRITAPREPRSERHFNLAAVSPWNDTVRPLRPQCREVLCSECPGCPEPVTPYDVETSRPWLTLLVVAVVVVGTVVLSAVFA